jgi:hypothetical protein
MFSPPGAAALELRHQPTKRCLPLRFIRNTNAAIERVAELCLADALELGAPCRFNFWVGHQSPFDSVGSFAPSRDLWRC